MAVLVATKIQGGGTGKQREREREYVFFVVEKEGVVVSCFIGGYFVIGRERDIGGAQ